MKFLSLEQLLLIHALVMQSTGGMEGIRDLGRLEAVVASQTQCVFGKDLYPTIHGKAAAMIRGIIGDHPFADGNKRTAMLAGLTLLDINDIHFIAKEKELEDFAVQVAVQKLDTDAIASWLAQHTNAK